ncbi:Glycosyl hydrolases family 38 N terminal domain [Trypanosoma vivax]|nr:Glycosyl hydrolases family 38 N terminal domain [Trypanosoma vivax]
MKSWHRRQSSMSTRVTRDAMILSSLLLFTVFPILAAAAPRVTVHLVAHTHDDMGWLKTVDQYTHGLNNSIQLANVNAIISNVVGSLLFNKNRTFTYVEIGFFSRWWSEQSLETQKAVRRLVDEGRLQFANGGWCMHDEATPYYTDMIDQTTLGHRWLLRELNVVPRVGWQADPFGHSSTQATMLTARADFLGTYFSRVDYRDYKNRAKTGGRQFWWDASPSLPELRTFAEINLHGTYCSPPGFKWDLADDLESARVGSVTDDVIDDKSSEGYNVPQVLNRFKEEVRNNINETVGDHIMWTMGCDFNYMMSELWYTKMDKLIKLVNEDGEFNVRYSTPYEYTIAKLEEERSKKVSYKTKTGDFFPYASAEHEMWTGYYTSRPTLKRLVRIMSNYWSAARQLEFALGVPTGELPLMSDALAVAQHHDAVSGTARQHVTFDYVRRLVAGYNDDFTTRLGPALARKPLLLTNVQHCLLSNVSVCPATKTFLSGNSSKLFVTVWNPSVHHVFDALLHIPVPRADVTVTGRGVIRASVFPSPVQVSDYSNNNSDWQPYTLAVLLSINRHSVLTLRTPNSSSTAITFRGSAAGINGRRHIKRQRHPSLRTEVKISNEHLTLHFGADGLLNRITYHATGLLVAVVQDWCFFRSSMGDNTTVAGGAYIMRPLNNKCEPVTTQPVTLRVIDNKMGVVEQKFGDYLTQRIMLRGDVADLEFTSFGIPIEDGYGRELVARFRTSVKNGGVFYTDSNGRQMERRQVDQRNDYPFTQTEPLAGNYYPVSAIIFVNDTKAQFSVFVDAAMGGTSVTDGEVLLTTNRRLLIDDKKGVAEPLNETQYVTSYTPGSGSQPSEGGKHFGPTLRVRGTITFTACPSGVNSMRRVREQQDEKYYSPVVFYSTNALHQEHEDFALASALSPSLQIITLQLFDNQTLLLRLAHRYAVGEDAERSKPVTINLPSLILYNPLYTSTGIDEVSLTTNSLVQANVDTVTIKPMDIRTFIIHLKKCQ